MILKRGFPSALIVRGFGFSGLPPDTLTCIEQILTHISSALSAYSWEAVVPTAFFRGVIMFDGDQDSVPFVVVVPNETTADRIAYDVERQMMGVDISMIVRVGPDESPSGVGEAILGELIEATFSNVPAGAVKYQYTGGGVDRYPKFEFDMMTVGISIDVAWEIDPDEPRICLK